MKKKFKLVLLVFVLMLIMVSCRKTDPVTLPNANDLQVITVTKTEENEEEPTTSITSKKDIADTIKLIQEKAKPTREQSNNNTPANIEDSRKMEIFYGKNEKTMLYLYQDKKFYIEKPYEGVQEIDNDTFNKSIGAI